MSTKSNTNSQIISEEIQQFLHCTFPTRLNYDGKVGIGYRHQDTSGVYPYYFVKESQLKDYFDEFEYNEDCDYYISANTFKSYKRSTDNLFALNNIVVDIDNHSDINEYDRNRLLESFVFRLKEFINENIIICPNVVVLTGRGIQLWYTLIPVSYKLLFLYRIVADELKHQIQSLLLDEFPNELEGLEVDFGASGNAAGYYRLPFSFNTKAKTLSRIEILKQPQYEIHEITGHSIPDKKQSTEIKESKKSSKQTENKEKKHKNVKNINTRRCLKIVDMVFDLQKNREIVHDNNGIHENRQRLCFTLATFAGQIYSKEYALEILSTLNKKFTNPLNQKKLEYLLSYTTENAKLEDGKNKAIWSNKTIIDYLELTSDEQAKYKIIVNDGSFVFDVTLGKPNASRDLYRKLCKKLRNDRVIQLHNEGINNTDINKMLHISRKTVYNILEKMIV